jgi:dipeptidyl aminopeptidase/acylaminoacyl peptidase
VDKEKIGICGTSYGAVVGTALLEKYNIKSVALRVPAVYTDQMMKTKLDAILADEKHIFNALSEIENTSVVKAIKKFSGSLLVIASENDKLIPLAIPETLIKEASLTKRKELKIMKNAPHALVDPKQGQEFADIITEWFKETLI